MVRASVVGATGYAGVELIRLLSGHRRVTVTMATSESHQGVPLNQVYPHVGKWGEIRLEAPDVDRLCAVSDVVFLALPHGLAMSLAPQLLAGGVRVIDFGADFRLADAAVYTEWYKERHKAESLLAEAVYGLPELFRDRIAGARLVANPGCYPTATLLGLAPLCAGGLIDTTWPIVVDAKSGVSGAGRGLSLKTHFGEVNENLRPYSLAGVHRHTPEIEQGLSRLAGKGIAVSFNPHLVPMTRGILATCYVRPGSGLSLAEAHGVYGDFYRGERFVRVLDPGMLPETKFTLGVNGCMIGLARDERTGLLVVCSALDNLVKGAAGQAVQNMNLIFGFDEGEGLDAPALYP